MLLDELRHNILHDRSDQIAGDSDQLWSDRTLIRYINESERRMARQALLIRDAVTPEATQVFTTSGEKFYTLHPSVIAVISAKFHGDIADLARAGHASLSTYHVPDTYFFDPSALSTLPPGKIMAYSTDEGLQQNDAGNFQTMTFRVYPAPDVDHAGTIHLRVLRTPLRKMRNLQDTPEIPEDHHLDMLSWAAFLALRIVDHDAGDVDRAQEFKQDFEQHVAEAKKVMMRKLFSPAPWGFGRNGFSWEVN